MTPDETGDAQLAFQARVNAGKGARPGHSCISGGSNNAKASAEKARDATFAAQTQAEAAKVAAENAASAAEQPRIRQTRQRR